MKAHVPEARAAAAPVAPRALMAPSVRWAFPLALARLVTATAARLGWVLALAACALGDDADLVQRLVVNANEVFRIPVATDRLTTVRFPSPVASLEAAFIATEPHPEARFLLSFQSGQEYFSLRALQRRAKATLNVVWNRQTIVLELAESDQPWLSVVFEQPVTVSGTGRARAVPPSRLFGLLDTARAYPLLKRQQPASVAGVESVRPRRTHDYGDYAIRIEEVLRFDGEDTLVFRIALTNKTAQPIHYLPQSLSVRAGQQVYFQSLTDATGLVPPKTEVSVYFAVTGTADGSRNDLSPRNEFMVLLSRVVPEAPPVTTRAVTPTIEPRPAAGSTRSRPPPQVNDDPAPAVYRNGIEQRAVRPRSLNDVPPRREPGLAASAIATTNAPPKRKLAPRIGLSISLTK